MSRNHQRGHRLFAGLLLLLLIASYICYALLQPVAALQPTITLSYTHKAMPVALAWPSYGSAAVGAVGYGVLGTHGPDTPLPSASTIKVLTALMVLKAQPLTLHEPGPTITLTQADIDSYNKFAGEDGSVVKVAVGEQITEYQALQALLLPSANNMAETLARWAYGSLDAYLTAANQYTHIIGLQQTTVTDPSGFDPATITTPQDLVVLGEAAMANPVIADIVQQATATIPLQGVIHNVNFLLGHDNIVGIKTGNSNQNPGCFLAAATDTIDGHPLTVVTAIMDGPNLGATLNDSVPLLESAEASFTAVHIAKADTTAATFNAPWQGTVAAVLEQDLTTVIWNGSQTTLSIHVDDLHTPQKNHATIGYVELAGASQRAVTIPLTLQPAVAGPSPLWRLAHPE